MTKKKKRLQEKAPQAKSTKNFIWLALAFALFVIGIHQALTVGFEYSYWIFMLSISLLLLHSYKKKSAKDKNR